MTHPFRSVTHRQPVLFVGHGSPMNVIEPNPWRTAWMELGQQFGSHPNAKWPVPQRVLCISAHWVTHGWQLTHSPHPQTIHDFGGFPPALYQVQYPAPGWSEHELQTLMRRMQGALGDAHDTDSGSAPPPTAWGPISADQPTWGLDHGCWGVLQPMFPQAHIPVAQLSLNGHVPPGLHVQVGEILRPLRDQGVLIVASGNLVHNLGALSMDPSAPTPPWASAVDEWAMQQLQQRRHLELASGVGLQQGLLQQAHPTPEHFWPLLCAAGATHEHETPHTVCGGFQLGSISMRSLVWG